MDRILLPSLLLAVTLAVSAVTFVTKPDQRALAKRGLKYALIAGLIVFVVFTALGTLLGLGLPGTSPLVFGLIAGGSLGGGWFCLNVLILEIGLWFQPSQAWAKGAAFATPVVLAAIGFGFTIYKAIPST